ncbi:helix-turn-helix transcriptional regulator [Stenotrophomonas maltophilia]|uniref:helix-turn-helix transcriptional regulator n=1 Tax=Stenotrophomonas maltophilia TaxID=40324 RepID=UPI003F7E90C0
MTLDLTPFVGHVIRQLRAEAGLNQEEAADLAAVDRSYWSAVERGSRSNPSIKTLQKFAAVFGVDLSDVFIRARALAETQKQSR